METFVTVVCVCIVFVFSFGMGDGSGITSVHNAAVQHGYAEYYLDSHYDKQWRWK